MKKNWLKKLMAGVMAACMITSLAACGDTQTDGKTDSSNPGSTKEESGKEEEPEEVSYTFSEALAWDGIHIWYELNKNSNPIGKDSKVEFYYIMEDGELKVYANPVRHTLGELAKMTDEEIIAMLESENQEAAREDVAVHLESAQQILKENGTVIMADNGYDRYWVSEVDYTPYLSIYEQYAADLARYNRDVSNISYNLHINTDSTGNNTQTEEWLVSYDSLKKPEISVSVQFDETASILCDASISDRDTYFVMSDGTNVEVRSREYYGDGEEIDWPPMIQKTLEEPIIKNVLKSGQFFYIHFYSGVENFSVEYNGEDWDERSYTIHLLSGSYTNYQVYDCYYGGYFLKGDGHLLTRTGELTSFTLDEVGTDGIEID